MFIARQPFAGKMLLAGQSIALALQRHARRRAVCGVVNALSHYTRLSVMPSSSPLATFTSVRGFALWSTQTGR
jgi:hypothetical protein